MSASQSLGDEQKYDGQAKDLVKENELTVCTLKAVAPELHSVCRIIVLPTQRSRSPNHRS